MFHGRENVVNSYWLFLMLNSLKTIDLTIFCDATVLFFFLFKVSVYTRNIMSCGSSCMLSNLEGDITSVIDVNKLL